MLGPSWQSGVADAAELSFRDIPDKTDSEPVPDCKLDAQELEGKASAISDVRVAVSLPSGRVVARYGMQGTDVVASLKTKLRESFGYGIAQQRLMTDMAIVENHWALKDCVMAPSGYLSLTLMLREWCVQGEFEELAVIPSHRPTLTRNVSYVLDYHNGGPRRPRARARIYRYASKGSPAFRSIGAEIQAHAGLHGFTKKYVIYGVEMTCIEKEMQADAWIDKMLENLQSPELAQGSVMRHVLWLIGDQKPKGLREVGRQRAEEWTLLHLAACFAAWKGEGDDYLWPDDAHEDWSKRKRQAQWQAKQAALEKQKGLWNLGDLLDTCKCQAAGIPADEREQFLQKDLFFEIFQMTLEDFNKLPMWRRRAMKKQLGLF